MVLFIYPRTGELGKLVPANWDLILGACRCTPQTCSFCDLHANLCKVGAAHMFGLSMQTAEYQCKVTNQLHLPFAILSNHEEEESAKRLGKFGQAMNLLWFEYSGKHLYKHMALMLKEGKVEQVFYPVFPPDHNTGNVLTWLKANTVQSQ
jgi:peroxiredoxin